MTPSICLVGDGYAFEIEVGVVDRFANERWNVGVLHSPTGRIHAPIMEVVDPRPLAAQDQGAQSRVEPIRDDGSAVGLALRGRVPSRGEAMGGAEEVNRV